MENNQVLELAAVTHPDPRVRRVGFDLSHPYVEQVWGAAVGPSGVALLRRLPVLLRDPAPARAPGVQSGRISALGIPGGRPKPLEGALFRFVLFQFVRWAE